jgi:hypothetical protein
MPFFLMAGVFSIASLFAVHQRLKAIRPKQDHMKGCNFYKELLLYKISWVTIAGVADGKRWNNLRDPQATLLLKMPIRPNFV